MLFINMSLIIGGISPGIALKLVENKSIKRKPKSEDFSG